MPRKAGGRKLVTYTCDNCGIEFQRAPAQVRGKKKICCSNRCSAKLRQALLKQARVLEAISTPVETKVVETEVVVLEASDIITVASETSETSERPVPVRSQNRAADKMFRKIATLMFGDKVLALFEPKESKPNQLDWTG